MIYLAGIAITLFLAILLAGKRNKDIADIILVIWLFFIAFHLLLYYLFIADKIYNNPYFLGIQLPYPLFHGPFLFLYTTAITRRHQKFEIRWLFHFLPVITIYAIMIPFFALPGSEKIHVFKNHGAGYEWITSLNFWLIIASGIVYVIASLLLLRRYRKSIEEEFSNTEKINLAWLRYLIYGIAVIWGAVLIGKDYIIFSFAVLYVFFLGYFGIRHVGIFISAEPAAPALSPEFPETISKENGAVSGILTSGSHHPGKKEQEIFAQKIKYEKSGLSEEQAKLIHEKLAACMTVQKPYTDFELSLAGLAKSLEVHPNHLSQVINSFEGKNFYDFINKHRVDEFKRLALLPVNSNYTLLSLAYDCGFNSKTSFNRNFKKVMGVSPSEWLYQQRITLK